jgi:DNA mismatch repair protein MutS
LFARIGAGDALAKNQSTFMTEMLETANILHNATDRSFIILDELGRGTSTYDGLALAKSISVHISQYIHSKTLFATHYHELTDLEDVYTNVKNYSVSVYETDKEVVFMKKVIAGKANKSYGIDVAKLAGLPTSVIDEATHFLQVYEEQHLGQTPTQSGFNF